MATSYTIIGTSGSYPSSRNPYVDCRSFLNEDELLVTDGGSPAYPAVTVTPSSGLTVSSVAVTGAEVTIAGNPVPAGKALALTLVGSTAGEYTLTLHVKTNASTPQTPNVEIVVVVKAPATA